jgi:hypothetical protein
MRPFWLIVICSQELLYKSLRNIDSDDQSPLFLNRNVFMRTSKQISDYLLCTQIEKYQQAWRLGFFRAICLLELRDAEIPVPASELRVLSKASAR